MLTGTFRQLNAEYGFSLQAPREPDLARYERDLRLHIVPRFGTAPLGRLTPRDVSAWLAEMLGAGEPASAVRRPTQPSAAAQSLCPFGIRRVSSTVS